MISNSELHYLLAVRALGVLLALTAVMVGASDAAGASGAEPQLSWSAAVPVDLQPAPPQGIALNRVSCATSSLCVAADSAGNVATSTDPSGGTSAWTLTPVDLPHDIRDVSCVAPSLCVAVDESGDILSSTNPTGGSAAWTAASVDAGGRGINGVSCASPSLCVAVDNAGDILSSTDPTGGQGAWSIAAVDLSSAGYKGANGIDAISCTAAPWCVAVDFAGNVLMSSNPAGGAGAWSTLDVGGGTFYGVSCVLSSVCAATNWTGDVFTLSAPGAAAGWHAVNADAASGSMNPDIHVDDISCPSSSLCVAVDEHGNAITSSTPTAGPETWAATNIDGPTLLSGISCPTTSLCVAVDQPGRVIVGSANQTLTVLTRGSGTGRVVADGISCPSTCSHAYLSGSKVLLSARPSSGSSFVGWSGACSGRSGCALTLATGQTVTATFARSTLSVHALYARVPTLLEHGLRVRLRCARTCSTRVVLKINAAHIKQANPPTGPIGEARIDLKGGTTRTVLIRLAARAKRWLAHVTLPTLTLKATADGRRGATTSTSTITIRR